MGAFTMSTIDETCYLVPSGDAIAAILGRDYAEARRTAGADI
jgi:hypothetical protein